MSSAYWYCPSAYIRKSRFLIVERQLGYDERGRTSGRALERVIYKFLADELLRHDSPFPAEHILCARDLGREAAISAGSVAALLLFFFIILYHAFRPT